MSRLIAWGVALIMALGAALLAGKPIKAPVSPIVVAGPPANPELARCRAAGEGALDDPACRVAWDAARARFFGKPPS
jgi:conjugative transfer region protein TrbK